MQTFATQALSPMVFDSLAPLNKIPKLKVVGAAALVVIGWHVAHHFFGLHPQSSISWSFAVLPLGTLDGVERYLEATRDQLHRAKKFAQGVLMSAERDGVLRLATESRGEHPAEHIVFGPGRTISFHVHRRDARHKQQEGWLIRDIFSEYGPRPRLYIEPFDAQTFIEMTTVGPTTWTSVERVLKEHETLLLNPRDVTKEYERSFLGEAITPGAEGVLNMFAQYVDGPLKTDLSSGITFHRFGLKEMRVRRPSVWHEARSILNEWQLSTGHDYDNVVVFGPTVIRGNPQLLHMISDLFPQTLRRITFWAGSDPLLRKGWPKLDFRGIPNSGSIDPSSSKRTFYYVSTPSEYEEVVAQNRRRGETIFDIVPLPVSYATIENLTPLLTILFRRWVERPRVRAAVFSPPYVADLIRRAAAHGAFKGKRAPDLRSVQSSA